MEGMKRPGLHIVHPDEDASTGEKKGVEVLFGYIMNTERGSIHFSSMLQLKAALINAIKNMPLPNETESDGSADNIYPFPNANEDE